MARRSILSQLFRQSAGYVVYPVSIAVWLFSPVFFPRPLVFKLFLIFAQLGFRAFLILSRLIYGVCILRILNVNSYIN